MSAALGRLLMAGMMMGAMSKNDDELITLVVRGEGPVGGLTVTANNRGQAKGFANHPHVWLPLNSAGKLSVGEAVAGENHTGTLSVVHDLPGMEPYSSEVPLVSGEIGDDLTYYFAASDQVPTSLGVGVLVDTDQSIRQAGGFIVQLMPFAEESTIAKLEENVQKITSVTNLLEEGHTPESLLEKVLEGFDMEINEKVPTEFYCNCSRERVEKALISIGRKELNEMIQEGKSIEMNCHFCNKNYEFTVEELKEILRKCK